MIRGPQVHDETLHFFTFRRQLSRLRYSKSSVEEWLPIDSKQFVLPQGPYQPFS